jgi:hypothetical protein
MLWWKLVPTFGLRILYRRRVAAARKVQLAAREAAATHSPSIRQILEQAEAEERDQNERNAAFSRLLNQARAIG